MNSLRVNNSLLHLSVVEQNNLYVQHRRDINGKSKKGRWRGLMVHSTLIEPNPFDDLIKLDVIQFRAVRKNRFRYTPLMLFSRGAYTRHTAHALLTVIGKYTPPR